MKLIADSGSTKTDWRLIAPDGHVKAYHTVGLNPYFQTVAEITEIIKQEFLAELLLMGHISQLYFYGAGCASEEKCNVIRAALRQCFAHVKKLEVASDMLGAARALCGKKPGMVGILGTGANACYYDGEYTQALTPSLGFILGDEGSGAYLGKLLVKSYLYKELPSDLHEAFRNDYPLTKDIVIETVYRKPLPNKYLASFTLFLKKHISHGYVQNLVYYAFDTFFEHHISKYAEFKSIPFSATGAVAYNFQDLLKKAAANREVQVGTIVENPIEGLMQYHIE